jgi:hypothetical protein
LIRSSSGRLAAGRCFHAHCLDHCGRPRSYGSEIVEDDDVAFFEGWDESLLDIGDETLAIDGAVDNEWRIDPIAPQRRDEGQRLPAPMGSF